MKKNIIVLITIMCSFSFLSTFASELSVAAGNRVSIEYTLKIKDSVVETNVNEEPFSFVHGDHQVLPAMEAQLNGMKVGQTKTFSLKPEDAYGAVQENALIEIPKNEIPAEYHEEGIMLQVSGKNDQVYHARVSEIKDETIILDFNHPLAGKTLNFEVKILDIKEDEITKSENEEFPSNS